MSFEESYLIPKSLYERLQNQKPATDPDDVAIKKRDYAYRFRLKKLPLTQLQYPSALILDAFDDDAKRNLAQQILHFIQTHGGGTIKWGDDYVLIVNGTRMEELDAREVMRQIVGEVEDPNQLARPVYDQLQDLGAPDYLLRFYHDKFQWDPYSPQWKKSIIEMEGPVTDDKLSGEDQKPPSKKPKKKRRQKPVETHHMQTRAAGQTRGGTKWLQI